MLVQISAKTILNFHLTPSLMITYNFLYISPSSSFSKYTLAQVGGVIFNLEEMEFQSLHIWT